MFKARFDCLQIFFFLVTPRLQNADGISGSQAFVLHRETKAGSAFVFEG